MSRKPNDGRGKTGGRKKGTPNKEKPLKTFLREHSLDYFTPCIPPEDADIFIDEEKKKEFVKKYKGRLFSQYELDLRCMKASDRAKAELDLLAYHTPKMQATAVDMTLQEQNKSLSDRLARLAAGEEIEPPEE